MTEMVYGAAPVQGGEPVLPKWWRTLDKWSVGAILFLFAIGILLGLAASPPLAAKNGFAPFHYVQRQAVFGGAALTAMLITSMMSPRVVRRLAVLGFLVSFVALAPLPKSVPKKGKSASATKDTRNPSTASRRTTRGDIIEVINIAVSAAPPKTACRRT